MGTDLNSVVKQKGSRRKKSKKKARRTSLPPAMPRHAGWTSQSARTTSSTKRGKLLVLCQAARQEQHRKSRATQTNHVYHWKVAKYLRPGMAASLAQ